MGKRLLAGFLVMCLLLGGCSADRGSSVSSGTEQDTYSELNQVQATEEPTEEELIKLVDQAMYDICDLAFNDMSIVLDNVFNGNIECDYSNQVIIDGISYQWTSRQYSEIVDYYSQTFTGEPLDWILASRYMDVDGSLYAFAGGGATAVFCTVKSIEKLEDNSYCATCQWPSGDSETYFSIQKTDAGYRISSISYRPSILYLENLRED